MRTIAIVNQKGGSGKTTTTVNLAATLAERKKRVLVIDLDAQRNTTEWFGEFNDEKGIYEIIVENGSILDHVHETAVSGVSIIPSSKWLIRADKALSGEVGAEQVLRDKLKELPTDTFDYVLIDCPPQLGIMTVNALSAVKEVLIPVEANILALKGVAHLLETLEKVKGRLNPDIEIAGVVACRVNQRTRHASDAIASLQNKFNGKLFKTVIRQNIKLQEAPSFQQPITQYHAKSYGAQDYRSLAKELMKQEGRV